MSKDATPDVREASESEKPLAPDIFSPTHTQRIGETVFLTIALPSSAFPTLAQEAPSAETPVSPISNQMLSSPSQNTSPHAIIQEAVDTQKSKARNLRDSYLISSTDTVSSLKAYSSLCKNELTICRQQRDIYETIARRRMMNNEHITDPSQITRRDLITLASVSFPLLNNIRSEWLTVGAIEEFLSEATASVTTCWYLLQGDGLTTVELTLPQYLPELVTVAKSSSRYRQRASYLAAQGFLLCGLVTHHRSRLDGRVAHCQEAVTYAYESGDLTLLVTCLVHLSTALRNNGQLDESLDTYLQAKRYSESTEIAGFSRSQIASELGPAYARQGKRDEVTRSLDEARTLFTEANNELPIFLRAGYGLDQIILNEGLSILHLGNHEQDHENISGAQKYWKDAAEKFGKIEQLPSGVIVPARIAAEIEIGRAKARALEGNMEGFLTSFEKGVRQAKELGSEKRKQEARGALKAAIERWPNDTRVTGLWELLV